MKNILFVIANIAGKGGTERMTISLANSLVNDYNVYIVPLGRQEDPFYKIDKRINICLIYKKKHSLLHYIYSVYLLNKFIRTNKIDIVINVDTILSLFSLPCRLFQSNLKVISWEHFNYKTNLGIKRRDYARILSKRYADAIVTLTQQDKDFYLESGNSRAVITVIPNFIEKIPIERSPLENKRVISIGRFQPQKGFDILIDIWKRVSLDPLSSGWILQIIGDGHDKDKIKEKIESLELSSSVQIIDATQDVQKYYLSASLYVMTSRFEGLPMVLIEAKSYGLPIISFDCVTGPRDIIDNGVDGYLIKYGDSDEMIRKIIGLMEDETLRNVMGLKSKENSNMYSKDSIYVKWSDLFQEILRI